MIDEAMNLYKTINNQIVIYMCKGARHLCGVRETGNKCSDRSMKAKIPDLLGNYERQIGPNRPTRMDRYHHRDFSLTIKKGKRSRECRRKSENIYMNYEN